MDQGCINLNGDTVCRAQMAGRKRKSTMGIIQIYLFGSKIQNLDSLPMSIPTYKDRKILMYLSQFFSILSAGARYP